MRDNNKNIRLRWLDGRESTHEFQGDPTTTSLEIEHLGVMHTFLATGEMDREGLDLFVEDLPRVRM